MVTKNRLSVIFIIFITANISLYAQTEKCADDFWKPLAGKSKRSSSYNTSGGNQDFVLIRPNNAHSLLELKSSSGIIQRLWYTLNSEDSLYLQKVKIKMIFDGETTVKDIPVGMFAGTGPWRINDITTPLINVMRSRKKNADQSGAGFGSFNIHFPMPFSSNVKIDMVNSTDKNLNVHYYVEYLEIKFDELPLLFHADYNIQSSAISSGDEVTLNTKNNFVFLDKNHYQGRYAGTILCVESNPDSKGKWYEGDDMFVIDNEPWPPRLHGTGTEDYFGMAWGFHRPYSAFDHGVSHYERNITDHDRFYDGRFVTYRWHINDPVIFYKSIHASIEMGHANECEQHYESVAIWYGKKN